MADVIRTVEETTETIGGKTYPITIIRLRSKEPFEYDDEGKTVLVDAVTITDAGKYGTSVLYTVHRDFTEEERRKGRENALRALAELRRSAGYE